MKVLCLFVSLIVVINAGYHEKVGIPLAARIKAAEDKLIKGAAKMEPRIVGGEVAPVDAHPYLTLSDNAIVSQVRLKILPPSECQRAYASTLVPGNLVCTSGDGGKGTCEGDSGGPLVVDRNGQKVLVGITSFGYDLCEAGQPSAFTRVASYLGFRHKHLG